MAFLQANKKKRHVWTDVEKRKVLEMLECLPDIMIRLTGEAHCLLPDMFNELRHSHNVCNIVVGIGVEAWAIPI
eukprot:850721-Rhodomonas_salina.1